MTEPQATPAADLSGFRTMLSSVLGDKGIALVANPDGSLTPDSVAALRAKIGTYMHKFAEQGELPEGETIEAATEKVTARMLEMVSDRTGKTLERTTLAMRISHLREATEALATELSLVGQREYIGQGPHAGSGQRAFMWGQCVSALATAESNLGASQDLFHRLTCPCGHAEHQETEPSTPEASPDAP